jgi:AcrR family transcriptional regulator
MARPPKITTEAIIAVARQVFLEQGFKASTLEIAEKAGISEASIFKRFLTKQALFAAAMGFSDSHSWIKVLAQDTPTAEIRTELTEICTQMLAVYQEIMPRVIMVMTQGQSTLPPPVPPPPIRDSQLLAGYLDRAIAQGHIRPCDSITIAHVIVGGINNYVLTRNVFEKLPSLFPALVQFKSVEPDIFIHNLIDMVWVGIEPKR